MPMSAASQVSEADTVFDATMGARHPLHILLAEYNATNQKVVLRILQRLGYQADVAGNGVEVLQALKRQPYGIVLMDMQMPEMDGIEATSRIRSEWAGQSQPRIIAMTANAMQGDREVCLAAGMDDYVSKPVRVPELMAALSRSFPRESPASAAAVAAPDQATGALSGATEGQVPRPMGADELEAPLLDLETLAQLQQTAGDPEFLASLISTYLEDAPGLMDAIEGAVSYNDPAALRIAAHSLKSNSAEFGAMILADLFREIEAIGRGGTIDGAAELLLAARREFERVQQRLESERERQLHLLGGQS